MKADEIRIEAPLTTFLFQKADMEQIPLSGTFELTPLCNFNCRMCYVRQTPEQVKEHHRKMMTLEQWKRVADEAESSGMLYLLLTGGEPLIWPDFWNLYSYLMQKGFLISINSNGSLINETIVERFKKMPPSRINITLYGASNDTYQRLCGISEGFSRVDKAISMLRDAGVQVKLNCSLTPYNACDLEAIVEYAKKREMVLEVNTYMFPPLRKDPSSIGKNDRFTPEQAAYWHIKRFSLQHTRERYLDYLRSVSDGIADPIGADETCYDPVDGKIHCRAGTTSFWATWDGYLTSCGMLSQPKADIISEGFGEAWKKLNDDTKKIRLSGICEKCDNRRTCHSCAAMAMTETGQFHKVPKYLCEMMEAMKKIAREQLKIYDTSK